jgi:hypothetical protein
VRTGLVALGTALLAVAVLSASSLYFLPGPPAVRTVTSEIPTIESGPNQTRMVLLLGANGTAQFTVQWQSTADFQVTLYNVPGCGSANLTCASDPPIASWASSRSGNYTLSGRMAFPFLLVWTDRAGSFASLQATSVCSWNVPASTSLWSALAADVAAGSLGCIGAVLLFLGLFVRSGVYREDRLPGGPRPAPEDPDGFGDELTAPRRGSPGVESAGPLREPPAPDR